MRHLTPIVNDICRLSPSFHPFWDILNVYRAYKAVWAIINLWPVAYLWVYISGNGLLAASQDAPGTHSSVAKPLAKCPRPKNKVWSGVITNRRRHWLPVRSWSSWSRDVRTGLSVGVTLRSVHAFGIGICDAPLTGFEINIRHSCCCCGCCLSF